MGVFEVARTLGAIGSGADADVARARRYIETLAATMVERGALDMAPARAAVTATEALAMQYPREQDQRNLAGIATLMLAERIAAEIAAGGQS